MRSFSLLLFSILTLISTPTQADEGPDLIRAAVARTPAWTSGRIMFHLDHSIELIHEQSQGMYHYFSFSGDSWAIAHIRNPGKDYEGSWGRANFISHDDTGMMVMYASKKDGPLVPQVHLGKPEPLSVTKDPWTQRAPRYAGGFMRDVQRKWIADHVDLFKCVGTKTVNDVPTKVCELLVTFQIPNLGGINRAHFGFNKLLLPEGWLRIYIAPQLGFAVVRVASESTAGKLVSQEDAWDFREEAPGLFIPRHGKAILMAGREEEEEVSGKDFEEWFIDDVQFANQEVPETDFEVIVKPGDGVLDDRGGHHGARFSVVDAATSKDFPRLLEKAQAKQQSQPKKPTRRAAP